MFALKTKGANINQLSQTTNNFFNSSDKLNNRAISANPVLHFTNQSPKINTGVLRKQQLNNTNINVNNFSLLDIPINKISKGTNLPEQFQRQTSERKTSKPKHILTEENETNTNNNFNTMTYRDKFIQRNVKTAVRYNGKESFFKEYERHAKTSQSKTRPEKSCFPEVSVKEIKLKAQESDIFFNKRTDNIKENFEQVRENYNSRGKPDHINSDIFNLKKDKTANNKNSEKYLDKTNKTVTYNVSSKSNSEWHIKNNYASLFNHCSTKFHILNPHIKNIFKTKEEICEESKNFNPTFRQKSLCEFIDLTRVGVPNPNKEYLNALNKSKQVFNRDSNICASYLDLQRLYKNLSDPPFVKKFI
jgi:hypothetical protein